MQYHRSDMSKKSKTLTPAAARRIGRLGGRARTPAQNAARAVNAQKAGRPRRVCKRCAQPVVGGHVDRELDDTCGEHGWRWEQAGKRHEGPLNPLDAIAAAIRTSTAATPEEDSDTMRQIIEILRSTGREVK